MERNRETLSINSTESALYLLLSVSLTRNYNVEIPTDVDWKKLMEISIEQGVAAIAWDGLQRLIEKTAYSPKGLPVKVKLKWYAVSLSILQRYEKQLESANELSLLWHKNKIRTLLLKGFAFADYYPNPSLRIASDMDCYLCGKYEEGNKIVEQQGIVVNREDYRHSTFRFKNVFVENHKICTTIRGKTQRKYFEAYLQGLLEENETKALDETFLEKPCDRFNALYFLQHSHRHFLREGITLRYICDWAVMVSEVRCFDEDFWTQCKENDLITFAESMTRLAYFVCGIKASWLKDKVVMSKQDYRLLKDCFSIGTNAIKYGNAFEAHVKMVTNMFSMRWKYKFFSERTFLMELLSLLWSNYFDKNPVIQKTK